MHKRTVLLLLFGFFLGSCQKFTYNSPQQVKQAIRATVKIAVEYVAEDKITLSSLHKAYVATGFSILVDDNTNKSYVLTNKHVCEMRDRAHYRLKVSTGEIVNASYVSSDSFADICLLEANAVISPLTLSDNNATQGDRVITMGSPDGAFPIVVDGIICGYYDMHMINGIEEDAPFEVNFRAQVMSAPIYHGSSGSPVLDVYGKVVGIVFAVRNDKEHISFMVPISEVIRFLDRSEYVHMN